MGDDDAKWSDENAELEADDGSDPSSGARPKSAVPASTRAFIAELERRAAGLTGAELDRVVSEMLDEQIERSIAAVPAALRDELRGDLRRLMHDDPSFSHVVRELRAHAHEQRR